MRPAGTKLSYTPAAGGSKTAIGKLTSIGEINQTADEIDITTLDSTGAYREYLQGFKDAGTLDVTGLYAPGDASQQAFNTLYQSGETVKWEIAFHDGSTLTFDGFVSGVNYGPIEVDGVPGFGGTIRLTGPVTAGTAA
jgi:predicted secreted protein